MKQKAIEKNDELILNCPLEVEVYADKDRFTQIMVNLVQNALQFTENGKIIISGKRIEHAAQFRNKFSIFLYCFIKQILLELKLVLENQDWDFQLFYLLLNSTAVKLMWTHNRERELNLL